MSRYRTLQDVASVPLAKRAEIVRALCRETSDVDERLAYVEAAFLPPPRTAAELCNGVTQFVEDAGGQLVLDLEVAS